MSMITNNDAKTQTSGGPERASSPSEPNEKKCGCLSMDGHVESWGITFNGISRGAIAMSNVYFANTVILLACIDGGGANDEGTKCEDRSVRIYGMRPDSLISNIAVAASLLSAFCMPSVGAIIDYTPHRRTVGIVMAALLTIISAIQIGTVQATWFPMAILQAIIFAVYQFQLTVLYAYYPEVRRDVGDKKIASYSSTWYMLQFCSQAGVNLVIIGFNAGFGLGTVKTTWLSQGITTLFCLVFLPLCWRLMSSPPRKHVLPKGESLALAGFKQNWHMMQKIWRNYKSGLRWFLISTVFGEAAASAVSSTAVIFLSLHIGLNATEIGIFFEVALIGVIFGTKIGSVVTRLTNPNISLQFCNLGLCLTTIIGCWTVKATDYVGLTCIWGFSMGIFLGWFYPCEAVFMSMCVPVNVETELAGFFNWCTQIIAFLPPLVYTIAIENNVTLPWALTVVALFFIPAIFFLFMCGPWEDILEEARTVEVDFYESVRLESVRQSLRLQQEVGDENGAKPLDSTDLAKSEQC